MINACEKIGFECTFTSVEELYYCLENNNILNIQKIISFEKDNGSGEYKFLERHTRKNNNHLFLCPIVCDFEISIKTAFVFSKSHKPDYLIFFAPFYSLKIINLINKYKYEYDVDGLIIYCKINFQGEQPY